MKKIDKISTSGVRQWMSAEDFEKLNDEVKDYIHLLEQYKSVADESNIVSKTNPKGIITYTNKKFSEISGYSEYELIGKNHNIIRHPDMPASAFKTLWETISNKKVWHGTVKNKKKDGGSYTVEATIIPILDRSGKIKEYIALRKDITRLVEQRKTIRKQTTDALTGYPNISKMQEDIEKAKLRNVILLNIDMFHAIVDFYSEDVSNGVIREVADRLFTIQSQIPNNFKFYKLYEDEFALVSTENIESSALGEIVQYIFSEIMKESIILFNGIEVHYSISMGVYSGKEHSFLNKSKMALKHARDSRLGYYIYDEKLINQHTKNINEVMILRNAIKQNRIVPFYQPIFDIKTGEIAKYESLARLTNIKDEIFLPGTFLESAKRSKLYPYVTSAVIAGVLNIAKDKDFDFTINLSIEDITDPRINKMIFESVEKYKSKKNNLIFEITESENIQDFDEVQSFIKKIKKLGCQIAIDDFGSGYSNFEYLVRLDIDFVKVDGSLIKNIVKDVNIQKIVKVILNFAKEMKYKTVAEFIENQEVFEAVKELGFDYCQGFYLGRPEPGI
ncbi:MAG: EAL domain-containing protein [Spirochaetia bacterium]|nr:EAL domain-containing protein [Spirochaetia bacterium]